MNLSVIRRTLILSTLFAFAASANEVVVTNPSGLQIAIDQASPGDVILLQPGTVYRGNFKLRSKPAGAPITIRTNGSIPSGRVGPTATLARIVSHNSSPAIEFLPNADNYRIVGVEITVESGIYSYDVVRVGSLAATRIEDQPDNIEFDRVYLHGDSSAGSKRGMMLSTNRVRVRRSYISDFKSKGQDAMAIAVCNGVGPFDIDDNYLEGSGYGIIFGGCNNNIPEIVPTGVNFSNNRVSRPNSWKNEGWSVKNLFEIKLGAGFRIEKNLFENNWADAQTGFAIVLKAVPNGLGLDGEPFARTEDITFRGNVVRNSTQGMNIMAVDGLRVENNLFAGVTGRLFQLLNEMHDVEFLFNTALDTVDAAFVSQMSDGTHVSDFVLRGNILNLGAYGIKGSGVAGGNKTLAAHFPGAEVDANLFIGGSPTVYPANNYFVAAVEDLRLSGYALPDDSPFKGIVGGSDPGFSLWTEPPPPPTTTKDPKVVVPTTTTTTTTTTTLSTTCSKGSPTLTIGRPVNVDYNTVAFTINVKNTDSAVCGPSLFGVEVSAKRPMSMQLDITSYTATLDPGESGPMTVTASLGWRRPSAEAQISALVTREELPAPRLSEVRPARGRSAGSASRGRRTN